MTGFADRLLITVPSCSLLATVLAFAAFRLQPGPGARVLVFAKRAMFLAAVLSLFVLAVFVRAFLTDDFSLAAVAHYSSSRLPPILKLCGVWTGSPGSLLLLSVTATVFVAICLRSLRTDASIFSALTVALGAVFSLAFSAVLVFVAKPFAQMHPVPQDGAGLSPVLHNPWMLAHPPAFLIAYAAFLVPFVIVLAAAIGRSTNNPNVYPPIRRWLLFAVAFLTIGIIAGARWAYFEPDWKGYWAWDPIQNLSLLPWLAAIVALHSLNGLRLADKFRRWTIVVAPLPFILSMLLASMSARRVLDTIHSFGPAFAPEAFLAFAASAFAIWLMCISRAIRIVSMTPGYLSIFPLEKTRILSWTNIVLAAAALVIGLTTASPAILRAFTTMRPDLIASDSFYENFVTVVGVLLVFLVGLYRLADLHQRPGASYAPTLASCGAGILSFGALFNLARYPLSASLACSLGAFSLVAVIIKLFVDIITRSRIAGGIAHLGFVVLVVAAGFASTEKTAKVPLAKEKRVILSGYTFSYDSFQRKSSHGIEQAGPRITVRKGPLEATLWPHDNTYPTTPRPTTRPRLAVRTGLFEDILVSFNEEKLDGSVVITARVKPFMFWLWLGAVLVLAGSVFALFGRDNLPRSLAKPADANNSPDQGHPVA